MSEAARIDLVDRAPLTEKQQNVYESIMQYQRVNGYAPTIREICKMVDIAVAVNAGAQSVLVMSGETDEAMLRASDVQPKYVLRDVAELAQILRDGTV